MQQNNIDVTKPKGVIKFIKRMYKLTKAYYFKFKDKNSCYLVLKNKDTIKNSIRCYI